MSPCNNDTSLHQQVFDILTIYTLGDILALRCIINLGEAIGRGALTKYIYIYIYGRSVLFI